MSNENYSPGFRDRLDRLRALRQRGHTESCANGQAYSSKPCSCGKDESVRPDDPPSKLATLAGTLLLAAMVPYFLFTAAWMRLWGLPKETRE